MCSGLVEEIQKVNRLVCLGEDVVVHERVGPFARCKFASQKVAFHGLRRKCRQDEFEDVSRLYDPGIWISYGARVKEHEFAWISTKVAARQRVVADVGDPVGREMTSTDRK